VRLVLASASPRRAALLRAAGYEFDIVAADIDETRRDGEPPVAYVRRLAADKSATAVVGADLRVGPGGHIGPPPHESPIILAADTTVVVDSAILGKPRDDEEVASMLRCLSGRRHEVLTGISLRRGGFEIGRVETTAVHFTTLTDDDVAWYVASGEGRDKAGAYAIQGLASRFIPRIEGSYSNVVGLPIAAVVELLREISGTPPDPRRPRRSD
jgi:septum formation protein